MTIKLTWDEAKRLKNLDKHKLDFADAGIVLGSELRLDVDVVRNNEARVESFAYVFGRLAVLLVVHTPRDGAARVISFRPASEDETRNYHDWLENDFA